MHIVEYTPNMLVECMKFKKVTNETLAKRTGLSSSFISKMRGGKVNPSIESLRKIGTVLGVKFL